MSPFASVLVKTPTEYLREYLREEDLSWLTVRAWWQRLGSRNTKPLVPITSTVRKQRETCSALLSLSLWPQQDGANLPVGRSSHLLTQSRNSLIDVTRSVSLSPFVLPSHQIAKGSSSSSTGQENAKLRRPARHLPRRQSLLYSPQREPEASLCPDLHPQI